MRAESSPKIAANGWAIAAVAIVVLAFVSRLGWLDLRPLHHDEGVNYWFSQRIIETGSYTYDPNNYHGPTLFFALFLTFLTMGVSEFSLRWPAAVFGIALVLLPLAFRRWGKTFALAAAVFLLLSPSITYFSRYAIHESLVVLLSALVVALAAVILERQDLTYLPLFATGVALLLATKETAVIVLVALGLIVVVHWRNIAMILRREGRDSTVGLAPALYLLLAIALLTTIVLPSRDLNLTLLPLFGAAIALMLISKSFPRFDLIWQAVALFLIVYVSFFSSFYQNPHGVVDSLRAFTPWLSRGVEGAGHDKAWWYYLSLLARYELPLLLFGIAGLTYVWRHVWARCLALWLLVALTVYSAIDYKTPWLLVNVTVPLALLAAVGYRGLRSPELKAGGLVAAAVYLAAMTVQFNFVQPWQAGNPYAYEHTDASILGLAAAVDGIGKERAKVLVHSDDYWPLPFYLRRHAVEYLAATTAESFSNYAAYDFVIFADQRRPPRWPEGYRAERFLLRPGVGLLLVSRASP